MAQIDPLSGTSTVSARIPDDELETPPLPQEHPRWVKDAAAISQRARRLLEKLRPIAIAVMTFWDHGMRTLRFGDRTLSIDASGSYRFE